MTSLSHTLIGILTMAVSFTGMLIVLRHHRFFIKSKTRLGKTMSHVFLSDAMIYTITLAFGIWAWLDLGFGAALELQIIRIPVLLFNIFAAWRLYCLIKQMRLEQDDRK